MSSPFTDVKSPMLFGAPMKEFECVQCKEPAETVIVMAINDAPDDKKPSIVLAYFLCTRCAALHWESAGAKVFASLKDSFA